MSKNYSVSGVGTSSSATKTNVELRATAAIRAGVWGWLIGQSATPNSTDFNYLAALSRFTAQGTGTAATPTAIDGGDVACVNTAVITDTVEPTGFPSNDMMQNPPNQRTNFFWQTYDGRELWSVAGVATGMSSRVVSTGQAIALNATVWFRE